MPVAPETGSACPIPVERLFSSLLAAHGPQGWWPAEDAFEIIAGALLVQRTAWRNAEVAVAELKRRALLDPDALAVCDASDIEPCIRSAGFFRTKAARLKRLAEFILAQGGVDGLARLPTPVLRAALLELDGIGPETADTILTYAFRRPAVVIDEYLRRLAQRLMGNDERPPDATLRDWITREVEDVGRLNELHALVVAHGKASCGRVPRCGRCRIRDLCRTGRAASDAQLGEGIGHVAQDA
jgi:endonuclease-3 related protein